MIIDLLIPILPIIFEILILVVYFFFLKFLKHKIKNSGAYYTSVIGLALIAITIIPALCFYATSGLFYQHQFSGINYTYVESSGYFFWFFTVYYWLMIAAISLLRILEFNREHKKIDETEELTNQLDNSQIKIINKNNKLIYGSLALALIAWFIYPFTDPYRIGITIVLAVVSIILAIISLISYKLLNLAQKIIIALSMVITLGLLLTIVYSFYNF